MKASEYSGTRTAASARELRSALRRPLAGFLLKGEGGALVEFAMVLPMMMMLITGLFSFGISLTNYVQLTQAVGSGGQYLATLRTTTSDPCADTLSAIKSAAPNFQSSKITLTLTMNGTAVTGSTCSGDQSYLVQGSTAKVNAKYPCNLFVYGMNFGTGCQLQAQITEYVY